MSGHDRGARLTQRRVGVTDCRRATGGSGLDGRVLSPRRLMEESVESGSEKPVCGKGRVVATVEVDLAGTRAEREMGREQIQFAQVGA